MVCWTAIWVAVAVALEIFSIMTIDYHRDADGVEVHQPGEKEKIQAVSDQFKRFQMMNFNEHHHCLRGTHLKTQGVSKSSSAAPFSHFTTPQHILSTLTYCTPCN